MGNQIARFAPAPLVSTEDYFSDFVSVARFEEELLGSRLFKVAKAKRTHNGGSQRVVVKVLPCSNAKELLSVYRPTIQAYCRHLPFGHNILSFNVKASPNGRNILIIRDYVDQSLVDRLCTRPFLCVEEKKWIAFQLLQSLSQLHSPFDLDRDSRVVDRRPGFEREEHAAIFCHGDIKAENVLLTSWGWTLLADPAPFKPCWLPVDNPSEFTHYFDSSRRRVCYLAPERFVECKESQPFEIPHEKAPLEIDPHGPILTRDIEIIEATSDSPKPSRMRDSLVGSDFTPVDQELRLAADCTSSDFSKQSVPTEPPDGKILPGSKSNLKGAASISSSLQSVGYGTESSNPESLVTQAMDLFSTG
ncbi:unnamed protein product [Dicrocoelium dendriticum]|nr:unnamed protein product [Dicrocoelium dendriticum]